MRIREIFLICKIIFSLFAIALRLRVKNIKAIKLFTMSSSQSFPEPIGPSEGSHLCLYKLRPKVLIRTIGAER